MDQQLVAALIAKVKALDEFVAIREEVAGFAEGTSLEDGVTAIRGVAPRLREIAAMFPTDGIVGPSIKGLAECYAITTSVDDSSLVEAEEETQRDVNREEIDLLKELLALHGTDLKVKA